MNEKVEQVKSVTILLTKYSDLFSRFITAISHNGYSHASISIDEDEEIFYSFNIKGFVIEKPKKITPKSRREGNLCIRIKIPESSYNIIKEEIERFIENRQAYSYSTFGVLLCLLRIPHKFQNQYFCSQFVAEVLVKAGAVELKKNESLYLPNHFVKGLSNEFIQLQTLYNAI